MEVLDIRQANDIDIVVTEDLFDDLIRQGWQVCECGKCQDMRKNGYPYRILKSEGVDVFPDYSYRDQYRADTKELINTANVIDGVPYVRLEELLKWKKAAARAKDLKDVELIENFLREQKIGSRSAGGERAKTLTSRS